MSSPRLDGVELVLVVGESVLYGIYLVLLSRALESLLSRKKGGRDSKILWCTAAFLFCTITAHFILDIARAFDAYIYSQGSYDAQGESPATLYFEDLAKTKYVVTSAFYVTTTAVGDGFMIYRLYIVWNRNIRIVLFPLVLEVGLCIVSAMIIWLLSRARGTIFVTAGGWITAYFAITFLTNFISTVLIAYRVWLSKRSVSKFNAMNSSSPIQRVINTLVQSAALYSVCLLLSLALYVQKNNVQYILAATNCPIVGIIFTMIAARSGKSTRANEMESEIGSGRTLQGCNDNLPMRPLAIKITTEVDSDVTVISHHSNSKVPPLEEMKGQDTVDVYQTRRSSITCGADSF